MKCPRCGCSIAKFKQEAGYKKSPKDKAWKRTDWTADCPRCGFHYNAQTGKEIIIKEKKK